MRFHITTQIYENYSDRDTPNWKSKGSQEYIIDVDGFNYDDEMAFKKGRMIVDDLSSKIEQANEYVQEHIIGWGFVPDDFQTLDERDQIECDGKITCPATRMSYDGLMETV